MWVAGIEALEPSCAVFLGTLSGSWITSGAAGLGASTVLWNVGIPTGDPPGGLPAPRPGLELNSSHSFYGFF